MPLTITARIFSGVVFVDVSGRLCVLDDTLRDYVNASLEQGHRAFVLNLANVPYVDSFGLGQLITIWTSIRSRGGRLVLLRPRDHVHALLRITKLTTIFQISAEEEHAVKSARNNVFESTLRILPAKSHLP